MNNLREDLSFCMIDGAPLFLDVAKDRYFQLGESARLVFCDLAAGRSLDPGAPQLVKLGKVLDVDPRRLVRLLGGYALQPEGPQIGLEQMETERASPWLLPEAIVRKWQCDWKVRHIPLDRILRQFRRRKNIAGVIGSRERKIIAAHRAARVFRTSRNRCLADSLALAEWLATTFCFPDLVLGVSLSPFEAHCWLQMGQIVLNDDPDRVRSYQPILKL